MHGKAHYGWVWLAGSAVLLVMGAVHPDRIPFGDQDALARMARIDAAAHGLAILGIGLLIVGQVGWSRMLGLHRPVVLLALVAAVLPAAGIVVAAALDGLVIPRIAQEWMNSDEVARAGQEQLIRFCVLIASALTRVYMLLTAVAILLWSWVLHRDARHRSLPWVGSAVGVAALATLVGGPVYVSVHELIALVVGQSVWMICAGVLMIREDAPCAPEGRDPIHGD